MATIDPHKRSSLSLDVAKDAITPGEVFFVNNSGVGPIGMLVASDNNTGKSQLEPLATIAGAQAKCKDGRGDIVYFMPGHAETISAVLALSVAGVSYIGVHPKGLRPVFTGKVADDLFNITGANVKIENFIFGAPLTTAQASFINVAAAGVVIKNVKGIGSVASQVMVDCIDIAAGGDDCTIDGVEFWNTVGAITNFINIEAAVKRLTLKNIFCFGDVSGVGIVDGATALQMYWENIRVKVVGTTKHAATLSNNSTGLISNAYFAGTDATLANNAALGTGVVLFDVRLVKETDGSKQGAQIPAVDA